MTRMMRLGLALSTGVLLNFSNGSAFAWGDLGHRVICEIAFRELVPSARTKVVALLRGDPEFTLFRDACTWPDHPRKRAREHYVNASRNDDRLTRACPVSDRCVVSAVLDDLRDLVLAVDTAEQLAALKYLGHWIGDIHQPLHVSFEDDRGGNETAVTGPCSESLHAAWDTCIISQRLGDDAVAVADDLLAAITEADRNRWTPPEIGLRTVLAWANESFAVSIDPATGYCVQASDGCRYTAERRTYEAGTAKKVIAIDARYLDWSAQILRERLAMAGIRLAGVLNAALSE